MCRWTRSVTRRGERVYDPELSIASFRRPHCRARLQNIVFGCFAESCATVAEDLEPLMKTCDTSCCPYVKSFTSAAVTLKQTHDILSSFELVGMLVLSHTEPRQSIHPHRDATRSICDNMDNIDMDAFQQIRSYPNLNPLRIMPSTELHLLEALTLNLLALKHVVTSRCLAHISELFSCAQWLPEVQRYNLAQASSGDAVVAK
jgi:hypothetical protein